MTFSSIEKKREYHRNYMRDRRKAERDVKPDSMPLNPVFDPVKPYDVLDEFPHPERYRQNGFLGQGVERL